MGTRIYLHEYINIIGAHRAEYFEHMTVNWREAAIERRQRTFGIWGTLGSTGRWPEVVNLWEYDDWAHLAETFAHETSGPAGMQDRRLAKWWLQAQSMRSGGYDRLLIPAEFSPTIAEVIERGVVGYEVFRHDVIGIAPGEARNYLAAVELDLVPMMADLGAVLVGAYRTALRDDSEVILIWAIQDWATWSAAEQALDSQPAALAWRARTRAMAPNYASHLMCSAPLSPTQTGHQP
jgi:hypothetical protein